MTADARRGLKKCVYVGVCSVCVCECVIVCVFVCESRRVIN